MSTVNANQSGELQQNTTAFSYAQAAKGRSPSLPLTQDAGKASSDNTEPNNIRSASFGTENNTEDLGKKSTQRAVSENGASRALDAKVNRDDQPPSLGNTEIETEKGTRSDAQDTINVVASSDKPTVAGQSQTTGSFPSSPEYGTTSTSTLPKEDDTFSATNGSSDSTSDKQSQTSQHGVKTTEKSEGEKCHNVTTSWDDDIPPPVPTLKEAAPPSVNVWHMRSQNQAKSKPSIGAQPAKPTGFGNGNGDVNTSGKGIDSGMEPKKQDSKKKAKAMSGPADDRASLGANKSAEFAERHGSKPVAPPPPPPPEDAISWPTPNHAVGEVKKRNHDRIEKSDKDTIQAPKPHGKEKWVAVPYVPTAVFNTPLPPARRGGRGAARGGREAELRGRNHVSPGNTSERPTVAGATNAQTSVPNSHDRSRPALVSAPNNTNAPKSKRASSAGPAIPKEQRKSGDMSVPEKRKDGDIIGPKASSAETHNPHASRRPSAPTVTKDSQSSRLSAHNQDNESSWSAQNVGSKKEGEKKFQPNVPDFNGQLRANGSERRNDGLGRPEFFREFQGNNSNRERGEQRGDRGRGGFRGRGGGSHSYFNTNMPNGQTYSNGYSSHHQSLASPSKPHTNHDRLPAQPQNSSFQTSQHQPRHYRNNSRSQSIPHSNQHGRFSNGQHGGPPHLAHLQTDMANEFAYLPAHQGAMTAMPFNAYGEQQSLFGMVNLQMNYYFSVENLCKDMYLRSHMDSQGFVFLELLAQFNRIKQLTNDMDLIRFACQQSQAIEYVNVDGIDRVRAREGWQQWVRKMEERDPSAQNEGPSLQNIPQYQPYNYNSTSDDHQLSSPRTNATGNAMDIAHYQPLNGATPQYGQGTTTFEQNASDASASKTPLSAAVSEFSPSARSTKSRNFSAADYHTQGTSVFTDSQVENLHILVRRPLNAVASIPPFHSSSSRTFSNGSIDGRSINDELSKFSEVHSKPPVNGDPLESSEKLHNMQRSRSPFSIGSPGRPMDNSISPPVLWIKDRQNSSDPLKSIPDECEHESYYDFRLDALKQRDQSARGKDHYNMQSLYQFWSHFLVRNFNAHMYEEFHHLALEDANQRDSSIGMRSLLRFYDESILSHKAVSDDNVARDFIDLVKTESTKSERPVFGKLRAVWRNGAFNMRNRSKLTKFVDPELKAELER